MNKTRALFVLLGLISVSRMAMAQESERLSFERSVLEQTEEHSESLANDLLDLSVALRRQDLSQISKFFAEGIEGIGFPTYSGPLIPETKWLSRRDWDIGKVPSRIYRDDFKQNLQNFLSHFTQIEDFRLKVKQADFETTQPVRGRARLFCFLVGRNQDGLREWVRGYIQAKAHRTNDGPWQITHWKIESLSSLVSEKDLFSEITAPAGLWEEAPPFGEPPNDGFVAHGAAVADVNEDGLLDLLTSGVTGSRLYLNEATGRFRDVSDESLVRYSRTGTGALFLDYDNDGDQDIFMAAVGNQILLQNQSRPEGILRFIDVSGPAGVEMPAVGFSAVAADVNRDGWTDIYVASYNRYGRVMPNAWGKADNGTPNLLFINQGDGRFREEAKKWGVNDSRWSYAAAFADVSGDGLQDLYVANDFGENALYINDGDRFYDEARDRGVIDPGNGMGVSFGDFDNDGDLDIHVTNMSSTAGNRILARLMPGASADSAILKKLAAGNSVFENLGDGTFRNMAQTAGGFSAGWAFGGGFFDFDNDGWEDEYSVNGFVSGKTMKDT